MSATSALAPAPAEITDEPPHVEIQEAAATAVPTAPAESQPSAPEKPTEAPPAVAQTSEDQVVGAALPTNEREQAIARIRQSSLPPALRERLAAVVEARQSSNLDIAACLEAIEQTLPDFLRASRENLTRPEHRNGDAFFQGGNGELSDAEAEALAQRQLARSGLLRGQRVKVAD